MKVRWLQNFTKDRQDSIWYGDDIVTIVVGRYHVTIGAYGDIRATINGNYYVDKCNSGRFAEYLAEEGITNDAELSQAKQNGQIEFDNNNWFEAFVWDDKEKDYVEVGDAIIDELKPDDDFAWIKPWLKELTK